MNTPIMRARLYELDRNGDPISVTNHEWVEFAMNYAAEKEGTTPSMDEWGDTQIGYEYMTKEGRKILDETGEYPERYWQINGIHEGQDCEVEDEHHFDPYTDHEWDEKGE